MKKKDASQYYKPERVLAIDLEHSSGFMRRFPNRVSDQTTGDVIGRGAAVLRFDHDTREFEKIDSFKAKLFRPRRKGQERPDDENLHEWDRTIMGADCWKYFWSKNPESLAAITVSEEEMDNMTRVEGEIHGLEKLREFIGVNETAADEAGERLRKVGDCVSFDYGILDQMIWEHLPGIKGMCFSVNGQSWGGSIRCTTSQEDLLLALVDNHWFRRQKTEEEKEAKLDDVTDRIRLLYGVPAFPSVHNHQPDQDAIHIACRYLMMQAIADGTFTLDEGLVEEAPKGSKRPYYDLDQAVKKQRV